jgi:hypothetical protein
VVIGALFLTVAASRAQTTSTPVPPAKPTPGVPLPDFPEVKLDYSKGSVTAEQDAEGLLSIVATGGVTLTFGDLRIQADKITYASGSRFIDATGNVLVTRGAHRHHLAAVLYLLGAIPSRRTRHDYPKCSHRSQPGWERGSFTLGA